MKLYGIKNCSSVKKARDFLDKKISVMIFLISKFINQKYLISQDGQIQKELIGC